MRKVLAIVLLCLGCLGVQAQFTDTFSYPDGDLTVASGGSWIKWDELFSGDMTVMGGFARLEDTSDLVRFYPNVLLGTTRMKFSFTLILTAAETAENYEIFLGSSSPPPNDPINGTNYSEGLLLAFDPLVVDDNDEPVPPRPGTVWFGISDGDGSKLAGDVPLGVPFNITGQMYRPNNGTVVTYKIYLDGGFRSMGVFAMSDPRGLNSIELFTFPDDLSTDPTASASFDDVAVVKLPKSDTNGDGCVDDADITAIILDFGTPGSHDSVFTDINQDGQVDDTDLTNVILDYGDGC